MLPHDCFFKPLSLLKGAWVAQSVEHVALDLRVMTSSPVLGSVLGMKLTWKKKKKERKKETKTLLGHTVYVQRATSI